MPLDPNSSEPPYKQLAALLAGRIRSGVYGPGAALPSGAQLAEEAGVSRVTVQNALKVLKADGLVVGRQGSGVFVREGGNTEVDLHALIDHGVEFTFDFYGYAPEHVAQRVGRLASMLREAPAVHFRIVLPGDPLIWLRETNLGAQVPLDWPSRAQMLAGAIAGAGVTRGTLSVLSALTAKGLRFEAVGGRALARALDPGADPDDALLALEDALVDDWFDQEWTALLAFLAQQEGSERSAPSK